MDEPLEERLRRIDKYNKLDKMKMKFLPFIG